MIIPESEVNSATILVVDDVPANLKTLSEMLKQCDYQVKPAQNGKAALKAALACPPDLVLLDIRMPEMDGYETCSCFKSEESLRKIPIIFISALGDTEDKIKAFERGGVDYITKPFHFGEVQARIRTHLLLINASKELVRQNIILEEQLHELKIAEDALRESEERYRSFFESLEAIKLIIDPVCGAIVDANQAAVNFYGYDLSQLIKMFVYDLRTMPKQEVLNELSETAHIEAGHCFIKNRLKDGRIRDVEAYSSRILYRGKGFVMYSIHDVTELRRLEQIKDDVERIIRHDLKSPLNCVINIPQMLIDDVNLTSHQREMLGLVVSSGNKMLSQINSSLKIHKIESGNYVFCAQECDLVEILRNNIGIVSIALSVDSGCVDLITDNIGCGKDKVVIQTDPVLLDIVLMNLLQNALEACDKKSKVSVDIYEVDEEFIVTISNSRPVPIEIRDKFFEKYITSGKNLGTGLGTYSAQMMMQAIGGKISMETSDEIGTKITLNIPHLLKLI